MADAGVVAPADKRFRRAHVKPTRRRPLLRSWRVRAIIALAALAAAAYTADRAASAVARLDALRVERINVHGTRRLSQGEVLATLDGLRGQSIVSLDLEHWRSILRVSPWVADASFRRTLPSTIDVMVLERTPLGIGRIGGALYLVDDRGSVIDEYGPAYADLDLPIIDGLSSSAGDEQADVYRTLLARRLLDALRAQNMSARISQIDVSDARNAVVLLHGDPTLIRLGHERFAERLRSYFELAPALRESVPDIDYVDLRFDERVYVRPAKAGARPVARPAAKARPTQTG